MNTSTSLSTGQKGFAPILILVGVLFVVVITGGAFYFGRQTTPKLESQNPTVISTPQVTSQPTTSLTPSLSPTNETANWKTYTNEKCKFSLQYPENWVVNAWPVEINSVPENICSVDFGKYQLPATREGDTELKKLGYLIEVWGEKGADFEKTASENDIYKNRANYKREKVTFNNLPAYRITGTGMDFPRDRLMVAKDDIVYSISVNYLVTENNQRGEAQKTFEQILSTFKFTN